MKSILEEYRIKIEEADRIKKEAEDILPATITGDDKHDAKVWLKKDGNIGIKIKSNIHSIGSAQYINLPFDIAVIIAEFIISLQESDE